jgi:Transposase
MSHLGDRSTAPPYGVNGDGVGVGAACTGLVRCGAYGHGVVSARRRPGGGAWRGRWISRASRSRLPAFVKAAKTIRKFRNGLLAAIKLGINNGRAEGLNNVVRLIIRRARGFRSPEAALALVMLTCGPITVHLPHERPKIRPG